MSFLDSPAPSTDIALQTPAHFSPELNSTLPLHHDDTVIQEVFGNAVSETLAQSFVFDEQDPYLGHRLDKLASTLFQRDSVDEPTVDSISSIDARLQYPEDEPAELVHSPNATSTGVTIRLTTSTDIIQRQNTEVATESGIPAPEESGTELYLPGSTARPTMDPATREAVSSVPSPPISVPEVETENRIATDITDTRTNVTHKPYLIPNFDSKH